MHDKHRTRPAGGFLFFLKKRGIITAFQMQEKGFVLQI